MTEALSAFLRTALASARAPKHKLNPSIAMDLPAPVSPVTTDNPCLKSTWTDFTTAKFSIDKDKTQIQTLKMLNHKFGDIMELYFANGGDHNNTTIPEANICGQLGIKLIDGLGEKIQSSSWLLAKE